ncbi:phosphate transport system protein [Devosia enhydra]|uniref:Phosphate-specific transport system accessory protein PhoU n=1 Tax=Devosia enhydra TaxID=665118 RepID=A0A1K2I1V1_9HYPH|nr:phosphate signaling complex protein PhoU [Devosia enhydra]SFZ86304.1 phosphate transport system protein [Devosia enhydra]
MPGYRSEHIVSSYEEELTQIAQHISRMGGLAEQAVASAVQALLKLDHDLAKQVVAGDKALDALHRGLDEMAVSIIARRQPMASDLRMIVTSIHIASDLERVGDMAKQVARRALQIEGLSLNPRFYNGVKHLSDLILRQLKGALDAYATRNAAEAIAICNGDDEVDALHTSLFRELLTYMMEDPRTISQCTNLLFCAKSLERVGDHATNIAEAAYYLETGKQLSGDVEELQRVQHKI